MIGFVLCSKEGPPVDFANPINPIEKLDGALNHKRELRFYNSEVRAPHYTNSFAYLTFLFVYSIRTFERWNDIWPSRVHLYKYHLKCSVAAIPFWLLFFQIGLNALFSQQC